MWYMIYILLFELVTLLDARHFAGLYRDFLEFSQTRAIRNAAANYRSRSTVF